jgi:hypothetical protein
MGRTYKFSLDVTSDLWLNLNYLWLRVCCVYPATVP